MGISPGGQRVLVLTPERRGTGPLAVVKELARRAGAPVIVRSA